MRRALTIILCLCLLSSFWACPCPVHAEDDYSLVSYYLSRGEKKLEKEDFLAAMNQFLIVMLLEPSQKAAREYLQRSEISAVLPAQFDQYKLKKFLDLADQTDFLNSRIAYVDESNERLFDFIHKNNLVTAENRDNINALMALVKPKRDISSLTAKLEQLRDAEDVETLGLAIKLMLEQKERSIQVLQARQKINKQLRTLKQALLEKEISRQKSAEVETDGQRFSRIRERLAEKEMQIKTQDDQMKVLREELTAVRLQFADMQAKMNTTDQKLAVLTKELAGMSLDVLSKEKLIEKRNETIEDLNAQLEEAQAQMQLIQGIIQEKDGQITEFKKQLNQMKELVETRETSVFNQPERIPEDMYPEDDTVVFTDEAQNKLDSFEQKLEALTLKYQTLEGVVQEKEAQIDQLNQLVGVLDGKIISYRQTNTKKIRELNQVYGILEIYKGRLEQTCDLLKKKEQYIIEVEQQLRGLESLFDKHSFDLTGESLPAEEETDEEEYVPPAESLIQEPPEKSQESPVFESTKQHIQSLLMNARPLNYSIIHFE